MKKSKYIFFLFLFLWISVNAQENVSGQENIKCYYKKIAGEKLLKSPIERMKFIVSSLKEIDYELIINSKKDTVVFRTLDKVYSDKFYKAAITHGGGNTNYYIKNKNDYDVFQLNNIFNKKFYIKTSYINKKNWTISNETKKINNYTCYKATFIKKENMVVGFDEKTNKFLRKEFTKTYTAWFCPEVPYSFGPDEYYGLPGLVFEGYNSNGDVSFVLDKIIFNRDKTLIKMQTLKTLTVEESNKLFEEEILKQ